MNATPPPPLTNSEKACFNRILRHAEERPRDQPTGLAVSRLHFDGQPVAILNATVYNRFTGKVEGQRPLAMLLDSEDLLARLTDLRGQPLISVSPADVDPDR